MRILTTGLPVLVGLTVMLTGCGGGDDSPGTAQTTPPPSNSVTPPETQIPVTPPPSQGPIAETPPDGGKPSDEEAPPATPGNSVPTISGTPPLSVLPDTPYTFVPSADDADGDILHFSAVNLPEWASFDATTGRIEGTPTASHVGNVYSDITITVTDGADDASLDAFDITVTTLAAGSVELNWAAPTQNEDGTPLTDLSGYKIYYGTAPGEFTQSVSVDNPGIVTYVIDDLVPATYYFVATAVNTEGSESDPSEIAAVTIS